MAIELPLRLDECLEGGVHAHAVRQAAQDFSSWFGDPQTALYFFPEYTDHGPQHVSVVLAGAEWLIREDAWLALTAEDAAVLILAAILHDCAMHLTADGFLALLEKPLADRSPAWSLLDRRGKAARKMKLRKGNTSPGMRCHLPRPERAVFHTPLPPLPHTLHLHLKKLCLDLSLRQLGRALAVARRRDATEINST